MLGKNVYAQEGSKLASHVSKEAFALEGFLTQQLVLNSKPRSVTEKRKL